MSHISYEDVLYARSSSAAAVCLMGVYKIVPFQTYFSPGK